MNKVSKPKLQENQEILDAVERIKKDPDDYLAFQKIIRVLHSFLQHLSLKKFFFVPGHNSDDIYQEGLLALATKAIPDYDKEKGPFIGFAKLCIKRHIITVLKSSNNNKNRPLNQSVSLDATVCNEEDGPVSIGGFLPNGDENLVESIVRGESFKRLRAMLANKLTTLESRVLDLYLKNLSYTDIVEYLNKNRRGKNRLKSKVVDNALCRIKKKALELEEQIERREVIQLPIFFDDEEMDSPR